jgi:hypothetical protein
MVPLQLKKRRQRRSPRDQPESGEDWFIVSRTLAERNIAPRPSNSASCGFVFLTNVALLMSIPLLTRPCDKSIHLISLHMDVSNYRKRGTLFAIGVNDFVLFKLWVSKTHP